MHYCSAFVPIAPAADLFPGTAGLVYCAAAPAADGGHMSVLFGDRKKVTVVGVIGLAVALVGSLTFIVPLRVLAAAPNGFYQQKNLVSDQPGVAVIQDSNLVNPWGVTSTATSPFWVADNVSGVSTLYSGDVGGSPIAKSSLVVTIPGGGARWARASLCSGPRFSARRPAPS